jgi:hypothetical protein
MHHIFIYLLGDLAFLPLEAFLEFHRGPPAGVEVLRMDLPALVSAR